MGKTVNAARSSVVKPQQLVSRWENPYRNLEHYHKGQIHCHSEAGDMEVLTVDVDPKDKPSPGQVLRNYQDKGYKFVCLTDHNKATRPPWVPSGMIHILSAEDGRSSAHHIEVLGINMGAASTEAANEFDSNHNGLCDWDTGPCSNLPGRLYYYSAIQGAITVLGHPPVRHERNWTGVVGDLYTDWGDLEGDFLLQGYTFEELLNNAQASYRGKLYSYTGIEVYNAGFGAWATDWWNQLLERGKRVWGFGGDDSHGISNAGFNRTWIMVNSDKDSNHVTAGDILQNIRAGNFFTVVRSPQATPRSTGTAYSGPTVKITAGLGDSLTISTDPGCSISIIYGLRNVETVAATPTPDGRWLTGIVTLPAWAKFARVQVRQQRPEGDLYLVLSQPLFNKSPQPRPVDACQSIADRLRAVDNRIQGVHEAAHRRNPAAPEPVSGASDDNLQQLLEMRRRIQAELDECRRRNSC